MQIVIPAYNEAARLPLTLTALRERVPELVALAGPVEVLVVDNASTDGTAQVAGQFDSPAMPVRVLLCTQRGKGAAVRAGLAASEHSVVVYMDADGATDMSAFPAALALLLTGADAAIGSRAVEGSITNERHSRLRERGADLFRSLSSRIVPGVADTQCGFKMLRGDLARAVAAELVSTGFSFDVELLARVQRRGARVVEFPVAWVDVPGSTFSPARHGAGSFTALAAILWRLRGVQPAVRELPATPSAWQVHAGDEALGLSA